MGASACKPAGSTLSGCSCGSHVSDVDAEPVLARSAFSTDLEGERAEIARLIESLARRPNSPAGDAIPGALATSVQHSLLADAAQLSSEENVQVAQQALGSEPGVPMAALWCKDLPEESKGGELTLPGQRPYAGMSVLELTTDGGNPLLQACSADRFFELIELESERHPEAPFDSKTTGFQCGLGRESPMRKPHSEPQRMATNLTSGTCAQGSSGIASRQLSAPEEPCHLEDFTMACDPECDDGSRQCVNGSHCVGQWSGSYLDGYGIERWPDGSVFIGDFCVGRKHGAGRLAWVSGSTYEGEFARDCLQGEGLYVWSDGRGYSGKFTENAVGPNGTMRWSDGRIYTGEFAEGKMHGHGKFQWPDGRSLVGQWLKGHQHGTGVIRSVDGCDRECLWRQGQFVRWLSCPKADSEELESSAESPGGNWQVSGSRGSPRFSRSPRDAVGEVLGFHGEGEQLVVENCSLGICKAIGMNFEL